MAEGSLVGELLLQLLTAGDGFFTGLLCSGVAASAYTSHRRRACEARRVAEATNIHNLSSLYTVLSQQRHGGGGANTGDGLGVLGSSMAGKVGPVVVRGRVCRMDEEEEKRRGFFRKGTGLRGISSSVGDEIGARVLTSRYEPGLRGVWREWLQTSVLLEVHPLFGWTKVSEVIGQESQEVPFGIEDDTAAVRIHSNNGCDTTSATTRRRALPDCLRLVHKGWVPNSGFPASQAALSLLLGIPVRLGIVEEERMLLEGSVLTVVGMATLNGANGEVAVSTQGGDSLGFYLTNLTYEQLKSKLFARARKMWWISVVFGFLAGAAWTFFAHRRGYIARALEGLSRNGDSEETSLGQYDNENSEDEEYDEITEVGDGELCCVCLQRPRNTVFADCGHRACCMRCAKRLTKPLTLQQQLQRTTDPAGPASTPALFACPLCRTPTSRERVIRIYN